MGEEITTVETAAIASTPEDAGIQFRSSFDLSTEEGRKKAFNASMAADFKVSDCLNKTITMVGYLVEPIETVDEVTGEYQTIPHVVIFDKDGMAYESSSKGMLSSVARLDNIYHFAQGAEVDIQFIERKARLGRMYLIKVM